MKSKADEIGSCWTITFEGLILDPRLTSIEGEIEILEKLSDLSVNVLEWMQSMAKYKYDRVKVRLKVYRESPIHKATLRNVLKEFDLLTLRITKVEGTACQNGEHY